MRPTDARTISAGETIRASVCVVGAGAAGISIALELATAGIDVLLLESGGYEPDSASQSLATGENVGRSYFPLIATRQRFFGGTTNHWGGVCRELSPYDFERRDWVPWSGWPISRAELDPYYARARELCELAPEPERFEAIPFEPDRFRTDLVSFSPPTRFGPRYRAALEEAPSLRILLHANAVELVPAREGARVERLRCATLDGKHFSVEARRTVLALGGLENARFLLASRSVRPAGVGNDHDLVGRFFMEHPHVEVGTWMLSDPALSRPVYKWPDPVGGYDGAHMGLLTLPETRLREESLLGWSAELRLTTESQESESYQALRRLLGPLRRGRWPEEAGENVRTVFDDLEGAARGLWERFSGEPGAGAQFEITVRSEPVPDPDSRLTLSDDDVDALGVPRPRLDWRLQERDRATILRGLELLALDVGRRGWGRLRIPDPVEEPEWTERIHGGWHHMGTTRMDDDPKRGVVDRHCRVHGFGDLYVAGSSVFATAGWANPTLTLVALALRTADRLREELGGGSAS